MTDYHEEESLGKVYDYRLFRRLLKFAKPYKWLIVASVVLLLIITSLELAQPYLIKIAIDEHINGINQPMVAYSEGQAPAILSEKLINFQDQDFVRIKDFAESPSADLPLFQIVDLNNTYFLAEGLVESNSLLEIKTLNNQQILLVDNLERSAVILSDEQLMIFREGDIKSLYLIGGLFFGILLLGFVLNYIQVYLLQYSGQKIIFKIRQELFAHLQTLSLSFFDKNPVGRLVTRVTNDTEALNEMYTNVLVNLFKDVFIIVGIVIVMLQLNPMLALISFISVPLIISTTILYRKYARDAFRTVRAKLARINATLNENISGMRIIHIFKREKQQFAAFDEINTAHYQASNKELKSAAIFRPSMDFIYSLSLALLLWIGGRGVVSGALEFGVLYAFIDYIRRFFQPINDLTEKYTIMQSAMASSERIFQLMDQRNIIFNPDKPHKLTSKLNEIEFDQVWFAYNEEEWVLKDVSFKIHPGEMVAFVGATGAGKSSIINLLGRFYDIQRGTIRLNGKDIKTIDKHELRKNIGIVLQDVFLFAGDISSNISLNNPNISAEEIEKVAKYVNAHRFIERLPNKYSEEVKERGSTLSQGQKQLLAFARTLAFNPSILVLDEATANIDTETELLIQDALKKLVINRTTIVVAHRLSTIQHADKIIVLHKGRIREMGNHQELLGLGGLYYKLYQLQYKEEFAEQQPPESVKTT